VWERCLHWLKSNDERPVFRLGFCTRMNLAGNVFCFAPAIRGENESNFCFVSFFWIIWLFVGIDFQAGKRFMGDSVADPYFVSRIGFWCSSCCEGGYTLSAWACACLCPAWYDSLLIQNDIFGFQTIFSVKKRWWIQERKSNMWFPRWDVGGGTSRVARWS